jgi:hypothetical protein
LSYNPWLTTTIGNKPHTELMEKEFRTTELEVGTKPLVVEQVKITNIVVEETYA